MIKISLNYRLKYLLRNASVEIPRNKGIISETMEIAIDFFSILKFRYS